MKTKTQHITLAAILAVVIVTALWAAIVIETARNNQPVDTTPETMSLSVCDNMRIYPRGEAVGDMLLLNAEKNAAELGTRA